MEHSHNGKSESWVNGQWGPAAFLTVLQILGIAGGGIWFAAQFVEKSRTQENHFVTIEQHVSEVGSSVNSLAGSQNLMNNRLTGVEVSVGYLKDAVTRIDGSHSH